MANFNDLNRGISHDVLANAETAHHQAVQASYARLMKNHVSDIDLIRILATEENMQKVKHRFEFNIQLLDNAGAELAHMHHIGEKTLQEVVNDMQNNIRPKMKIEDFSPSFKQRLDANTNRAYTFSHKRNGVLESINIRTTFRKG